MNPEQRLLVIQEYMAVKFLVLLICALTGLLCPQWMRITDGYRPLLNLYLIFLRAGLDLFGLALIILLLLVLRVLMDMLNDNIGILEILFIDDLCLRLFCLVLEIDFYRHEGAVFLQSLTHLVLIGEFQTILCQMQRDCRSGLGSRSLAHIIFCTAVTLPVNGLRSLTETQCIDFHQIRYHECRIESESEVSDDLVAVRLILILFQELRRAGKSNLCDVTDYLVRSHTNSVIGEYQCFFLIVNRYGDLRLISLRKPYLAYGIQFFSLGYGIGSVRNQFPDKNILIRIHPFLDYWKNVVAVNRQISMSHFHTNTHSFSLLILHFRDISPSGKWIFVLSPLMIRCLWKPDFADHSGCDFCHYDRYSFYTRQVLY